MILCFTGNAQSKCELIIDDMLYRLRREAAVAEGARNMLKLLNSQKKTDPKIVQDVSICVCLIHNHHSLSLKAIDTKTQSEEKLDLIRLTLKKYR